MANKNFMDASEVPRPTGDAVTDGRRTYSFLCNLVGQLGYQVEMLTQQVESLQKQVSALSSGKDG